MNDFFTAQAARGRETNQQNPGGVATGNQTSTEDESMEKKTKGKKTNTKPGKRAARGGLAADQRALQAQATTTTEASKPRQSQAGTLMGCTVASVVRKLGAEGVTSAQATAILAAKGITLNPVSLRTYISDGKTGNYGKPADLTKAQVEELKTLIPAPATATAAAK